MGMEANGLVIKGEEAGVSGRISNSQVHPLPAQNSVETNKLRKWKQQWAERPSKFRKWE